MAPPYPVAFLQLLGSLPSSTSTVAKSWRKAASARYYKTLRKKDTDILFNGFNGLTSKTQKHFKKVGVESVDGFGFQNIGNAATRESCCDVGVAAAHDAR